jgi:aldose 1-epimerase
MWLILFFNFISFQIKDSMFEIKDSNFDTVPSVILSNTSNGEYVEILPDFGGIANAFVVNINGKKTNIIEGYDSEVPLKKWIDKNYRGTLLFPFPNRLKNGLYTFNGKMFQFPINDCCNRNNAVHGFVAAKSFTITKKSTTSNYAMIELSYKYNGEYGYYPFPFDIKIIYKLTRNSLEVTASVENTGNTDAPFGLGWHPYITTGTTIDKCLFKLPKHHILLNDENMIPTGKVVEPHSFLVSEPFEATSLDTGIELLEKNKENVITIIDPIKEIELTFNLGQYMGGFQYVQLYTPPERQSIAIEPQTCAPDMFNNKKGMLVAKPGEKFNFTYKLSASSYKTANK